MKSEVVVNNHFSIPIMGLGTYSLTGDAGKDAMKTALDIGYRHLDTAEAYGNQREVGEVIREHGIDREDVFITSKIWPDKLARDNVRPALEGTLEELGTDYVDLYLVHWPNPNVPVSETLEQMNVLKDEGKIRAIGVSNFGVAQLSEALESGEEIVNNQIEFHLRMYQSETKRFCDEQGISVTAYSPLGRGHELTDDALIGMARKYQRTPAQILLNWLMGKDIIVIPRSGNPDHLHENFEAQHFDLMDEDVETLDQNATYSEKLV